MPTGIYKRQPFTIEHRARIGAAQVGQKKHLTHGMWGTSTYRTWEAMLRRCLNPAMPNYRLYGARGIQVCAEWVFFENFLADMGERPPNPDGWSSRRAYYSLDRIDNNGNYEPSNCRWATPKEQTLNTRDPGGWITRRLRKASREK